MDYVGFTSLDEILKIKDKEKVKAYAQEAEARFCPSWVIRKIWDKYFELVRI